MGPKPKPKYRQARLGQARTGSVEVREPAPNQEEPVQSTDMPAEKVKKKPGRKPGKKATKKATEKEVAAPDNTDDDDDSDFDIKDCESNK